MRISRRVRRDECRATSAKRMRELRLSLGYKTAASFARAIGYPPAKIRRYEREGFIQAGPMMKFVWAMEKLGLGGISIDWLLNLDTSRKWRWRPAKRAVRTEGNVVHVSFGG